MTVFNCNYQLTMCRYIVGSDQYIPAKQHVTDSEHGARSIHRYLSSTPRSWLYSSSRYTHRCAGHLARVLCLQCTAILSPENQTNTLSLAAEDNEQHSWRSAAARAAAGLWLLLLRLGNVDTCLLSLSERRESFHYPKCCMMVCHLYLFIYLFISEFRMQQYKQPMAEHTIQYAYSTWILKGECVATHIAPIYMPSIYRVGQLKW